MQNRNNVYIGVAIVLVIALAAIYVITHKTGPAQDTSTATSTVDSSLSLGTTTAAATDGSGNAIIAQGQGTGTMQLIPNKTASKAPDYTKPIAYSSSIAPSLKTALQAQFNITVAALNKDKYDFNSWIDLGAQHHMAGDEQAAATIWEYVSLTWPTNVASFNNLGDLYANFLKNYAKAETNFLQAIKNKPSDTNPYRNLFTLYYTMGYNKNKAEAILKRAIVAAPKAVDMQVLLARYYRDTGRTAEAKAEYNLAIANAQSQSQTSLATTIQAERDAF